MKKAVGANRRERGDRTNNDDGALLKQVANVSLLGATHNASGILPEKYPNHLDESSENSRLQRRSGKNSGNVNVTDAIQ
jgi:hypothetical protein